jgi:hypothetical protein
MKSETEGDWDEIEIENEFWRAALSDAKKEVFNAAQNPPCSQYNNESVTSFAERAIDCIYRAIKILELVEKKRDEFLAKKRK